MRDEKKKRDFVAQVVDAALLQAAESSRLRDWLIFCGLRQLERHGYADYPNIAEIMLEGVFNDLSIAFDGMIDQDDKEFFKSSLYKNGPTFTNLPYQCPTVTWKQNEKANS